MRVLCMIISLSPSLTTTCFSSAFPPLRHSHLGPRTLARLMDHAKLSILGPLHLARAKSGYTTEKVRLQPIGKFCSHCFPVPLLYYRRHLVLAPTYVHRSPKNSEKSLDPSRPCPRYHSHSHFICITGRFMLHTSISVRPFTFVLLHSLALGAPRVMQPM